MMSSPLHLASSISPSQTDFLAMPSAKFIPPTDANLPPLGSGPRAGLKGMLLGFVLAIPLAALLYWACGCPWAALLVPTAAAAGFAVRVPRTPDGKIRIRPTNVFW